MKIYIDLVLIINFFLDFILLLSVAILLKRNVKTYRLFLGAFIGSLSVVLLFISINNILLFMYKIIISIVMLLAAFSYKNLKYTINNLLYLYLNSIILGGFLYFLNVQFSYKQKGIVFYNEGLGINAYFLIIFSPIIIYIYIRQTRKIRNVYNHHYKVDIYFKNNKKILCNGLLDTGNSLTDPYKNWPIILINKDKVPVKSKYILVPFRTITDEGMIKCIKVNKIVIDNKIIENVFLGLLEKNIIEEGIDCILPKKLWEE